MKNKLLLTALAAVCTASCAIGLTACAKHEHDFSEQWEKDATNHWHECSGEDCEEVTDTAAHTYGNWTVTTTATDERDGERKRECTVCGYEQTETIDKLTHTHKFADGWTKDETGHWHAATCSHAEETDGFAAHTYGEWEEVTPATEQTKGEKKRACTVCGFEETDEIPVLDHTHSYTTEWAHDATNHWHACTKDGCPSKSDSAAHAWDNGTVTKQPTCIAKGSKTYTCTVCGETKTEEMDMVQHAFGTELHHDATGHWYECTTPNCTAKDFHAHTWSIEGRVTKQPTASAMGETSYKCTECDEYDVRVNIPVEPLAVEFDTPLTTTESVINYKFAFPVATERAQLYEFEFEGNLTINWNGSNGLEETANGTVTAESSSKVITLPAGTRALNIEVTAGSGGISLQVTRRYAVGEMQNPDAITVGTAKTQALTANTGYYYAFTLEEGQQLTASASGATLAFLTEEGTALTSSENLAAHNFAAGSYLLCVTAKATQSASVLLRATTDEDYSKVATLPKEVTADEEITADGAGVRYFVFTATAAGTLKVTGVASSVGYYSDAQYKNNISNNLSLGANAKVWMAINFAQGETAKVEFEEAVVMIDYSVTYTDAAGNPIPNQKFKILDGTKNEIESLTSGADGKIEFTLAEGAYTILHEAVYNDPYKWATYGDTILAENPVRAYKLETRFLLKVTVAPVDGDDFEGVAVKVFEDGKQVGEGKVESGVAGVYCTVVSNKTYTAELDYDNDIYLGNGTASYTAKSGAKEATVAYPAVTKGIKYVLTLVDGENNPLPEGITVTLKKGTATVDTAETDSEGVARFGLLAPDEYTIELSGDYLTETKTSATQANVTVTATKASAPIVSGSKSSSAAYNNHDNAVTVGTSILNNQSSNNYYNFTATATGVYIIDLEEAYDEDGYGIYIDTIYLNGAAASNIVMNSGKSKNECVTVTKLSEDGYGAWAVEISLNEGDQIVFGSMFGLAQQQLSITLKA